MIIGGMEVEGGLLDIDLETFDTLGAKAPLRDGGRGSFERVYFGRRPVRALVRAPHAAAQALREQWAGRKEIEAAPGADEVARDAHGKLRDAARLRCANRAPRPDCRPCFRERAQGQK